MEATPSPVPPRLMKAPEASHPLPQGSEGWKINLRQSPDRRQVSPRTPSSESTDPMCCARKCRCERLEMTVEIIATNREPMTKSLKLLQIEDSESDASMMLRLLRQAGFEISSQRVEDAEGLREALKDPTWDVIVADYHLPGFDAPGALRILQECGQDIPCIVVSGKMGEDTAVEMMKSGAHDYLTKNNLARLAPAVERELADAETRRENKRPRRIAREPGTSGAGRGSYAARHVRFLSPDRKADLVRVRPPTLRRLAGAKSATNIACEPSILRTATV